MGLGWILMIVVGGLLKIVCAKGVGVHWRGLLGQLITAVIGARPLIVRHRAPKKA